MQVIPAVDVLGGAVVRLRRGDYGAVTRFGDDPVAVAGEFTSAGADMVHVVNLEAARSGTPAAELWKRLGDAGVRFQAAGGIRSAQDAVDAVAGGAARVAAGTTAVWEPAKLAEMADAIGGERLVAAVDVRAGRAHGAGWLDEGRPVSAVVAQVIEAGVGRIMVTSVSRDGTLEGPDVELVETVMAACQLSGAEQARVTRRASVCGSRCLPARGRSQVSGGASLGVSSRYELTAQSVGSTAARASLSTSWLKRKMMSL